MTTIQDNYGMVFSKFRFKTKGFGEESMNLDPLYVSQRIKLAVALSNGKNYDNNDIIAALSSYFNKPFVIPTFTAITLTSQELDLFR
jgi:hypothetical protein